MKSKGLVALVLGLAFAGVVLAVACLGWLLAAPPSSEAPPAAVSKPNQVGPRSHWDRSQVDLSGGITVKESVERSTNGDVEMRMTRVFRNGKIIMITTWNTTTNNKAGHTACRAHWLDDEPVLFEVDEDGDGIFELLTLWDDKGPTQVFDLTRDERLIPVDKARLKKMQDDCRFMSKTFKPIAEGAKQGVTKQEMRKRIGDAIEKAQERAKTEQDD
jgi:hypothetical protein